MLGDNSCICKATHITSASDSHPASLRGQPTSGWMASMKEDRLVIRYSLHQEQREKKQSLPESSAVLRISQKRASAGSKQGRGEPGLEAYSVKRLLLLAAVHCHEPAGSPFSQCWISVWVLSAWRIGMVSSFLESDSVALVLISVAAAHLPTVTVSYLWVAGNWD